VVEKSKYDPLGKQPLAALKPRLPCDSDQLWLRQLDLDHGFYHTSFWHIIALSGDGSDRWHLMGRAKHGKRLSGRINVAFSETVFVRLQALAEREERSVASIVRQFVREALERIDHS
jgi:hypothetical protein